MSETAMTAPPAGLTRTVACGPAWCWLAPAAEMAASVASVWPAPPVELPLGPRSFPRLATRTPGAGAGSLRAAREFTTATLARWGIAERSDDIVVVVSELLTNAVRHARPAGNWGGQPIRLGLLQPGPCVLCAVADPSEHVPTIREPVGFDESGRGLHVVGSLSDDWGWTAPNARGKVVWAMFATEPVPPSW
jgi:anti-sigma regulatory factor (Ser/Thr protein kinase)